MPASHLPALESRAAASVGWRRELQDARTVLRTRFFQDGNAARLLKRHSRLVDATLRKLWRQARLPASAALLAGGGYGRGELYPHSDIDLVILLAAGADDTLRARVETLVSMLWDVGLEASQSVRTIDDCLREGASDISVQTSLLETRLITGARPLFEQLQRALRAHLDPARFWDEKIAEQRKRHARHHETANNLEPNVKEGLGGLRDLQTVLWLANAAGVAADWDSLARQDLITASEARRIKRDEGILQQLRIRLHYLAGRREDRLLFDYQSALAEQLGLRATPTRLPSELLMQRYYRTVKEISLFTNIVLQNLSLRVHPGADATPHPLNGDFRERHGRLELLDPARINRDSTLILDCFHLLQRHPALTGIEANTMRALWRARAQINPAARADARNRARFMAILREPRRVTFVLRLMNQFGVLGRYLPAFGRIVGQMQHDLYHVYTVDEHILKVLRNLRRFAIPDFAPEFPFCSRLMSGFAAPEVLYLAALFHDIAKGRGGDHSRLGSTDARRFCQQHGVAAEDAELVAWLVEHHLLMSATAQKQDLSDPEVLERFARIVQTERRLRALYLLTVADIRGTSPKVWNAWKGKLLEDLYRLTERRLAGAAADAQAALREKKDQALQIVRQYALADGVHAALWRELDDQYFQRHDSQEIAWHTRLLRGKVSSATPVVRARLSPVGEGMQVMIYCPDQAALFARICGFFDRINYDVIDAKVYTTRHNYALDTFQVADRNGKAVHYRDFMNYVEHELAERLSARAPLAAPAKGRLSRHLKHFPLAPSVVITPEARKGAHTLAIVAGDRPGLLYTIALTLVEHNVNLDNAKITTLGERAEDTFLISGANLTDSNASERLRADLLARLTVSA